MLFDSGYVDNILLFFSSAESIWSTMIKKITCLSGVILLSPISLTLADDLSPTTPIVTFQVYSDTAAELFWTRSSDDTYPLIYSVSRDGEVVYSGDGTSFFDDTLLSGAIYTYEVSATGTDGMMSGAAVASFSTDNNNAGLNVPDTPVGLHAAIYSSSAIELFWERSNTEELFYEVHRDGIALAETDGTSLFISEGLLAGVSYGFEVFARRVVDSNGQSSAAAILGVTMPENVYEPAPPAAEVPAAPENIRFERYSDTAAELFWDRQIGSGVIVVTDVHRDNEYMGSTEGNSFFDSTRVAGNTYRYSLTSRNVNGDVSDTSVYVEQGEQTFHVDDSNIDTVIDNIIRIATGNAINDMGRVAQEFSLLGFRDITGLVLRSTGDDEDYIYDCEGGGTGKGKGQAADWFVELDECSLGNRTYSGQIARFDRDTGFNVQMTDFTLVYENGDKLVLTGWLGQVYATPITDFAEESLYVESYEEFNQDGTKRPLKELTINKLYGSRDLNPNVLETLEINWTSASGPFSNDVNLSASGSFQLLDGDTNFSEGQLNVVSDSGLELTIDADNGDLDSFRIDVTSEGSVVSRTIHWDDENRFNFSAF